MKHCELILPLMLSTSDCLTYVNQDIEVQVNIMHQRIEKIIPSVNSSTVACDDICEFFELSRFEPGSGSSLRAKVSYE